MPLEIKTVKYPVLLEMIASEDALWTVLSAINFEECSTALCRDILSLRMQNKGLKLRFHPFRLVSRRPSSWSALELVKNQLQEELERLATRVGVPFGITQVEYPVTSDVAGDLLENARGNDKSPPKLILDLSAVPREIQVFLCDAVLANGSRSWLHQFSEVYLVHTPPERITSRLGPGPFSVGGVRSDYNPEHVSRLPESLKTTVLIFPGYQGFEAKSAVDAVAGHQAMITVAVNCFEGSFLKAIELLIGNLALVADAAEGMLTLEYYFSEDDALRVAFNAADRAVRLCEEYPRFRHAFLTAPFGAKSSVTVACLARHYFIRRCNERAHDADTKTDVLLLPTSQSVSLYSRGARPPHVVALTMEDSGN